MGVEDDRHVVVGQVDLHGAGRPVGVADPVDAFTGEVLCANRPLGPRERLAGNRAGAYMSVLVVEVESVVIELEGGLGGRLGAEPAG